MKNVVKVERVNATITGTLDNEDVDVTINYDYQLGGKPKNVNITSVIPDTVVDGNGAKVKVEPTPGIISMGTRIHINHDKNGQKSIHIDGSKSSKEVVSILEAMEIEVATVAESFNAKA